MFSSDQVERYIRTFLDCWTLRPRRFMEAIDLNPSRYLTPYRFFFYSLLILFTLFLAEAGLAQTALVEVPDPRAIATWALTLFVVFFLVNSLVLRAISRLRPVRGNATLVSILNGQCYTVAIVLPFTAVVFILSPFLAVLGISTCTIILIGFMWSVVVTFGWQLPLAALANGVSTGRIVGGLLLWGACLGAVIGAIGVIVVVVSGW